jgi:hypothetical protein
VRPCGWFSPSSSTDPVAVPRPSGVSRTSEPSFGTETSRVPSGAQAASRADGTRANTDIVQPGGTST